MVGRRETQGNCWRSEEESARWLVVAGLCRSQVRWSKVVDEQLVEWEGDEELLAKEYGE